MSAKEKTHSPCSASKLKNLKICPNWIQDENAPVHWVTERGTAMHQVLETFKGKELLSEEEQELVDYCYRYLGNVKEAGGSVETEVLLKTHEPECEGWADVVIIPDKRYNNILTVIDWKFSFTEVDAAQINDQGKALALGAFLKYPFIDFVHVHFVHPRLNKISVGIFERKTDVPRLQNHITSIVERWRKKEEYNLDLSNCDYCGLKGKCPAWAATANALVAKYSPADLPEVIDPLKLSEPSEMAKVLALIPIIEKWCAAAKFRSHQMAFDEGKEIPGYQRKIKNGESKIIDPILADQLAQKAGLTWIDILDCLDMSVKKLADKISEYAPKGQKGEMEKAFRELLIKEGAAKAPPEIAYLEKIKNKNLTNQN